jgi:class 3 adenylate cyclase/CHASE2 domain-containing sensor protein
MYIWERKLSHHLITSSMTKIQLNPSWWVGAVAGLLSAGMWLTGTWQPLEQLGYNLLYKIRFPAAEWDRRIAVIAIDEKSLLAYGRVSSWDRNLYVQLLQRLAPSPPSAIGFDLILSESSPADKALAEEIEFNGSVVLAVGIGTDQKPLEVLPELAQVARLGHAVARADGDGIIREIPLYIGDFPALSVALLEADHQSRLNTFQAEPTARQEPLTSLPPPAKPGSERQAWVNWPAPVEKLSTYSFVDVVEGKIEPRIFTQRIVLVGVTAAALDPLRTPFNQNPPTSAIYLHAAALDNLLEGKFLQRFPTTGTVFWLLLLAPLTARLLNNRSWQGRLLVLLLLLLAWWGLALLSFSVFQWWLPTVAPIGTMLLAGAGLQLREQYEKQQLMSLFAQHVSPQMAETIWQRKGEIFAKGQLEPHEMTATVLFMDIRSFTSIAEKLPPRQLLSWLNLYLEEMAQCLMDGGGIVDKYIGDAIMAVFGIPLARTQAQEIKEDACRAIAASLAMYDRLSQLNQRLQAEGKPPIEMGIGIHTGPVIVGSVGGFQRLNYSVVGDTVNVAARLEAMNKQFLPECPYQILVSESTFAYVSDRYLGQAMGSFQLRGRTAETKIYAIVGKKSVN